MKLFYEVKTVNDSVKDVDEASRRVKVVISQMGSKDLDNDVIDSNAYNKTIAERGPKGVNLIWHLTDHNPSLKSAVGKFSEIYKDGNDLVGVTDIPNTSWGNDMFEFYKTGTINQHSVGFRTIKSEPVDAGKPGEYNLIKEILLFEGSSVLWGANPNTPTLTVGKSFTKEEAQGEYEKLAKEITVLIKSMRDGKFTDTTFELIEMRINQIEEKQKNIIAALMAQPSTDTANQPVITTETPVIKQDLTGISLINFLT